MPRRAAPEWKSYAAGSEVDHFAAFCREHLELSNDRWAGMRLELEGFQQRLMGEALAFDEDGIPCWNSVVIVMPRKNGKTQLLAAYAVYRLLTSDDMPEILLAAASDRNAGRLFKAAANFIRRSAVLSRLARVRDHAGEIVRNDGLGVIYRVASDPNRLHGYDASDVICDELAQWTKPSLEDAYAALTSGGGARSSPRTFTITTAGEAATRASSILGRLLDAAERAAGRQVEPGLAIARIEESKALVFNYEAPTTDPHDVKAMKLANPAPWITEEYLARQAANPELTDAQVLQLHGCVWAASETTFVAPDAWAARKVERELEDGEEGVLCFDGSERRDHTVLGFVTLDGFVKLLNVWKRPAGASDEWRVPRREVKQAVADAMRRFEVVEFAGDPPGWYAEFDEWAELYGDVVVEFEVRQAKRFAPACERFRSAVHDGWLSHDGDPQLAEYIGNAVAYETLYGAAIRKDHPDSPRKIDGAVVAVIGVDRAWWHNNEGSGSFVFDFVDPHAKVPV